MSPFFQTEPTPPAACPTAQTTPTLQPTSSLQLTSSLNKLMWLRPGLISTGTTHKPVCSKHCLVAVIGQAVDKRPQWVQQDGRPQRSQPSNGTKMCVQNTEVERLWASDSSGGDAGPAYPQAPTFLSTSLGKRWCSLPFKQSNLILTKVWFCYNVWESFDLKENHHLHYSSDAQSVIPQASSNSWGICQKCILKPCLKTTDILGPSPHPPSDSDASRDHPPPPHPTITTFCL